MKRIDALVEDLATELIASGNWGFCLFQGWGKRGFYYFRHETFITKITFKVSSECASEERVKRLLKCELRRRWSRYGFRNGFDHYGKPGLIYQDPNSFRHVVRSYIRNRDSNQIRLA